jgi:hypothetical protein
MTSTRTVSSPFATITVTEPPGRPDAEWMIAFVTSSLAISAASGLPGGSVTVKVAAGDRTARVDVIDEGAMRACAPHGLGKGLAIVAQLADVFGAEGCDRWFALRTGGAL